MYSTGHHTEECFFFVIDYKIYIIYYTYTSYQIYFVGPAKRRRMHTVSTPIMELTLSLVTITLILFKLLLWCEVSGAHGNFKMGVDVGLVEKYQQKRLGGFTKVS